MHSTYPWPISIFEYRIIVFGDCSLLFYIILKYVIKEKELGCEIL